MKKFFRWSLSVVLLLLAIGGAGGAYWYFRAAPESVRYRVERVEKGSLERFISATGTVEPEELVNVGAQVGGMVTTFGVDVNGKTVDYGSVVKSGTILAKIDDSLYSAEVKAAAAQKLQAVAAIRGAEASIQQATARRELAAANWTRAEALNPQKAIARSEYDAAQAEHLSATASIASAIASRELAEAQLAAAEAALDRTRRNLEYCVISSPVEGIIIDRRVNVGQTVNSSMNAPSLFLIAKDLRRMQVWASVNEADIGEIKQGMAARFSVDAFPAQEFVGEVQKIRLNATMSQNVVTYVVEIGADNSDGRLLPYLTANVKFITAHKKDALQLPNTAFRYRPDPERVDPAYRALAAAGPGRGNTRTVWKRQGEKIVPIEVKTGLNSGSMTEILSGDLREGDEVVTGELTAAQSAAQGAAQGAAASPFVPRPPARRR